MIDYYAVSDDNSTLIAMFMTEDDAQKYVGLKSVADSQRWYTVSKIKATRFSSDNSDLVRTIKGMGDLPLLGLNVNLAPRGSNEFIGSTYCLCTNEDQPDSIEKFFWMSSIMLHDGYPMMLPLQLGDRYVLLPRLESI